MICRQIDLRCGAGCESGAFDRREVGCRSGIGRLRVNFAADWKLF